MTDEYEDLIDESTPVPSVKNDRLDIFDCWAAFHSSDPEAQFGAWGFDEEEIEIIKQYIEEHREELEQIEKEQAIGGEEDE